jgi:tripartite-type tricarboxylate transporter receptor subunit TctC
MLMNCLRIISTVLAAIAAATTLAGVGHSAPAENYPIKPIRLVVAYAPGGSTDLVARLLAEELGRQFGWRVVVDNRAGGGTLIGTETVARSAPDGYTLFYGTNATVINTVLRQDAPYKLQDFAPVTMTIVQPLAILVGPRLKATTLKELIAQAKAHPGKLNFASSGHGSLQHIAGELLKDHREIDVLHVPYKGAGPALVDLLGGNVDFMITSLLGNTEHIKAGRLRVLATTGTKRAAATPDVPCVNEIAPGYEAISWQGVFAPAATTKARIDRLYSAFNQTGNSRKLQETLAANAMELSMSTPAELHEFIYREQKKYAAIVQRTGAKID